MVAGAAAILDPDAEAHPARLMTLRRASGTLPIAEAFDDLVEPLCKVAVNAAVAQSKRLAQGKQILATKIIGVDPQSPRDHVDLRFRRKARLGSAKAAKRPRRNRVGAHRISARRDCQPLLMWTGKPETPEHRGVGAQLVGDQQFRQRNLAS